MTDYPDVARRWFSSHKDEVVARPRERIWKGLSDSSTNIQILGEHRDYTTIDDLLADTRIQVLVDATASRLKVPPKDLAVKTYLHLPRFHPVELADLTIVSNEVERLAHIIQKSRDEAELPAMRKLLCDESTRSFYVDETSGRDVELMVGKLHYLNSIRENSLNLRLIYRPQGDSVGIISISDFDVHHVEICPYLPEEVRVFSRIYTLDNLPKNATSYFVAAGIRWLRHNIPSVKLLLMTCPP